jgi:predicted nuclease with TOPRIM domain
LPVTLLFFDLIVTAFSSSAMREVQNAMRSDVNRFAIENKVLTKNIDQLESEVERLKPVERKLRGTVARNGDNTDKLVDLVAENRRVINEMKVGDGNAETPMASYALLVRSCF